jgi:hypothetical protein
MANGKCRSKEQDARERDYRRLPAGKFAGRPDWVVFGR